jgi:Family of unknown function (DUF6152)
MRWVLLCLVGAALSSVPVSAHHSIASAYDESRRVNLDGVIKQFQFVNPHPYLVVDVQDTSGATQSWQLEMDNRGELVDVGMTSATFKPGDRVVVTGSPSRGQPRALYIRSLERPADGFLYEQVGFSPRIRVRGR